MMLLLSRYIFKKCLFNTLLVLAAFVLLLAVFNILGQLGDLGKKEFTLLPMLFYTMLLIPNYAYLLMPLSVLIGVMLALLNLVNYSEYAVIRTSGISLQRISMILLSYGICFSLFTFLLGEYIAPYANDYAQVYKNSKTHEIVSTTLHSGVWSKDGLNSFVNIKQIMPDSTILGISEFHYDDNLHLHEYLTASEGSFNYNSHTWTLTNAIDDLYTESNIIRTITPHYVWHTSIEPKYFSVLIVTPENMSALGLLKYMHHLAINHQSTERYQIAFWGKLLYPVSCISLALLALIFIPNNRRNIHLGSKLFAGILIGVSFFFITRLINYMALLFAWNAIAAALIPTVLLLAGALYFVSKHN